MSIGFYMILANARSCKLSNYGITKTDECVEQQRVLTASTEKGEEIKNRVSLHYQRIYHALEGLVTQSHWCRLHLVQLRKRVRWRASSLPHSSALFW